MTSKTSRAVIAGIAVAIAFSGCASYKIDKTAVPSPEDVAAIGKEIGKVRDFQQAVYDVSTFAVDRCDRKTVRVPFSLLTLGTLESHLSKEKIAAYHRAGGFDEQWHVIWALAGSGLAPGDAVVRINGAKIENNKSGFGEFPLQRYFNAIYAGQDAAEKGKPFQVTLASGKQLEVQTKPSCRTVVWAMPLAERSAHAEASPNGPIVIAANAIQAAQTADELRYLAALAVYYSASSEANKRRYAGIAGLGAAALAIAAAPVLAVANGVVAKGINQASTSGMVENAALFATQVVFDMGGSPTAGLALVSRLEARNLAADRVMLDPNSQAKVKKLATHLMEASRPQ